MVQLEISDEELMFIISGIKGIESEFGLDESEEEFLNRLQVILKKSKPSK